MKTAHRKNINLRVSFRKLRELLSSDIKMTSEEIKINIENIRNNGGNINEFDSHGETLLYQACKTVIPQSPYIVKQLLNAGANPNLLAEKYSEDTPLIALLNFNRHIDNNIIDDIVNEFLKPEYNVDIGMFDKYKHDALYYACYYNMPLIAIKLLNSRRLNPCLVSITGDNSLYWACKNSMEDVALKIIELCPNLINTEFRGETIQQIVEKNNLKKVKIMFDELTNLIYAFERKAPNILYDTEAIEELGSYIHNKHKSRSGGKHKKRRIKTKKYYKID